MKKIPETYDNPIDNYLLKIVEKVTPFFRKMKLTPNDLTSFSLLFGISSIYFIYKGNYILGSILYLVSYFFDCCDGYYARKYNMVTEFGDYYDHVKDILVYIGLIFVVHTKYITKQTRQIVYPILFILFILTVIHFGCQERIYNKDGSKTLNCMRKLCPGNPYKNILVTRYVGSGTFVMVTMLIIIYLGVNTRKQN
jgi:phosphatidylglycerophosphate synthase